jgi:2-dehydro-3-deoxygluconokinase
MATLLTLGETMGVAATSPGSPLRTATQLRLSTAGAEATVAVGIRRLGHTAVWVGTVGADEIGCRVVRELTAEGVDTARGWLGPGSDHGTWTPRSTASATLTCSTSPASLRC